MEADEISRIRTIPLAAVLEALGAERDPKDPARNWRLGASRITVTDSRFYDHNEAGALHRMRSGRAGGGGAIDLVQYVKNVDFRTAIRELAPLIGRDALESRPATASHTAPTPDSRSPPAPATHRSARARTYLTQVRAIPERIVDQALLTGNVFSDTKGNVVFRLSDETGREVGYEVRGTFDRPYHSVHGEKGLFIVKADARQSVAFVESGIEALSYHALHGRGLVVSTTGNATHLPVKLAAALKDRGYEVVAAFNADAAGDRMSDVLSAKVASVRRHRPDVANGKDWNDQLVAARGRPLERADVRGSDQPRIEPTRQANLVAGLRDR